MPTYDVVIKHRLVFANRRMPRRRGEIAIHSRIIASIGCIALAEANSLGVITSL